MYRRHQHGEETHTNTHTWEYIVIRSVFNSQGGSQHRTPAMLIRWTECTLGWSDLMIVGRYSMTGAVHLTAVRLIEHAILMCLCFCLAVLAVVCYPASCCSDRTARQRESVSGNPSAAPSIPIHLSFLSKLFFCTIVPGQLFLHTSSSGNCLAHNVWLGPLPKSNFSSRFRELGNRVCLCGCVCLL